MRLMVIPNPKWEHLIWKYCELTEEWQGQKDSNPRPTVLETVALPTELYPCIGFGR